MHYDYKKQIIVFELSVTCSLKKFRSTMKKAFIPIEYNGSNAKEKYIILCCEKSTIGISSIFYQS